MPCIVKQGTAWDAIKFGIQDNLCHKAQRLTNSELPHLPENHRSLYTLGGHDAKMRCDSSRKRFQTGRKWEMSNNEDTTFSAGRTTAVRWFLGSGMAAPAKRR